MAEISARGRQRTTTLGIMLAAWMLTAAACSSSADNGSDDGAPQEDANASHSVDTAPGDEVAVGDDSPQDDETSATAGDTEAAAVTSGVSLLEGGLVVAADMSGPTAELITLQDSPFVAAALYPRPDYEANPWSQWGQGIALDDGRVITAIGDHLGADGNSFLFVYDPDDQSLTRISDVLSALDHDAGSWGYGKIHSQMVDPGDGGIYFMTYYGTRRDISFDGSYEGDVLFRLDKETLEIQPVGIPVPRHGVPSLATDGSGLIYGEAVDPLLDGDAYPNGGFFVFDVTTGSVRLFDEDEAHGQFRNILVGPDGVAWFARDGGGLFRYDPQTNEVVEADIGLAAELRASTHPAADGTVYGITEKEDRQFFAFETNGTTRDLGTAPRYTTSLALTPDESRVLFVPGAHGNAYKEGAALIALDVLSGAQTTIVELDQAVREEFGLVLGGTYSVTVDAERNLVHIGFNAGTTEDEPWGEVVFVVVELPT